MRVYMYKPIIYSCTRWPTSHLLIKKDLSSGYFYVLQTLRRAACHIIMNFICYAYSSCLSYAEIWQSFGYSRQWLTFGYEVGQFHMFSVSHVYFFVRGKPKCIAKLNGGMAGFSPLWIRLWLQRLMRKSSKFRFYRPSVHVATVMRDRMMVHRCVHGLNFHCTKRHDWCA